MAHQTLDARGLSCPVPIFRTNKALKEMASGQTLAVMATDPGSAKDFVAFCSQTGHQLVKAFNDGRVFYYEIKKV